MKNKKNQLHHMTWKEIDEVFKDDPVILIPMGSMEEHGPHSITGDYLAAETIANRIAEKSEAYSIPVIPFGHSEYFRGFPGTISFSVETIKSAAEDICQSLIEHGITKMIFINGHYGNASLLDNVARKIKREKGIMIGKLDLWQSITPEFKKELYGDVNPSGHGGEPLTSVMKYLYPDDMRMDLLEEEENRNKWDDLDITHISRVKIKDIEASFYFDMEQITSQGVMGNPKIGTPEIGEKIVNRLVSYGVEFVDKLKNSKSKLF